MIQARDRLAGEQVYREGPGVLVGSKLSKQCAPGSEKAKSTPDCCNRSMAEGGYFPLLSTFKPTCG